MSDDGATLGQQPSLGPRGLVLEHRPLAGPLPSPETVRVNVGVLLDERLQPVRDELVELRQDSWKAQDAATERLERLSLRLVQLAERLGSLEVTVASIPLDSVTEAVGTVRSMVAGVAVEVDQVRQDVAERAEQAQVRAQTVENRLEALDRRFDTVFLGLNELERNSFSAVLSRAWRRVWRW